MLYKIVINIHTVDVDITEYIYKTSTCDNLIINTSDKYVSDVIKNDIEKRNLDNTIIKLRIYYCNNIIYNNLLNNNLIMLPLVFNNFTNVVIDASNNKKIFICDKTLKYISEYSKKWSVLNPDYEICLYDDEMCHQFLENNFSKMHAQIFKFIKDGPIKSDFWRCCVLYKYGGIYADADIEPVVALGDFIDNSADMVVSISRHMWDNDLYNPDFLKVRAGDQMLRLCIEVYCLRYLLGFQYDYWEWSIVMMFSNLKVNDKRVSGLYEVNGKKYQLLIEPYKEVFFDKVDKKWLGVRVLNSTQPMYNKMLHKFND